MKGFIAFTKKEMIEAWRTYKLLIVGCVFLFFGIQNPVTAKIMPELMSKLMSDNIEIVLAAPQALDSWVQFFKNMTSILMILFVILFSGAIPNEISKGTLVNMLTKGLQRKAVILSKLTSISLIWTASYALCFIATYGYTAYLLPDKLPNIFFSAFCLWLYGELVLSCMMAGGAILSSMMGTLIFTGAFAVAAVVINIIPKSDKFSPYSLCSKNISLLTLDTAPKEMIIPIIVAAALIAVFMWISIFAFNKKRI